MDDTEQIGKIIFNAFSEIADKHGFPREFQSVDIGINVASSLLSHPSFYSVVAEDTTDKNGLSEVIFWMNAQK